jgi:glyoxylase-like metal-dependent hydrolase (beta-lactamase superfamily II)
MSIQIDQLPLGAIQTNCYIVGDSQSNEAIIIDPAADPRQIMAVVQERSYSVKLILATHTHWDHVLASYPIKESTGAPFRLHAEGLPQHQMLMQRAAYWNVPSPYPPAEVDSFIEHGEIITLGRMHLEARYTPGHSPGHLTFVMHREKVAFVGDCVFKDGFGRTDFPGCSAEALRQSILEQILTLPEDYLLLSGHGERTTVGREKNESAALAYFLNYRI